MRLTESIGFVADQSILVFLNKIDDMLNDPHIYDMALPYLGEVSQFQKQLEQLIIDFEDGKIGIK